MIVARRKEINELKDCLVTDHSEFIAIYGRRRIGKTFLVREVLKERFVFHHTGVANVSTKDQLENFEISLKNYGLATKTKLKNWFEAFDALASLIKGLTNIGKKVIFLDELPWMDTHKSKFIPALEHFWNGFASYRNDIMLVVCGSATSWIIKKVINNHGGLHNRITHQIYLRPFTLKECEELSASLRMELSRRDILNYYMILGGVPYYWSLLSRGLSHAQNIDKLFFSKGGELTTEFSKLYASLFKVPEPYLSIVTALSKKKKGMTREEIASETKINDGGKLTKYLVELEQCDFICKYSMPNKLKKDSIFQLIDGFTLFYFTFMKSHSASTGPLWMKMLGKPKFNTWCGLAFERVCLLHTDQIRESLGISGIITAIHSWQTKGNDTVSGTQIDMLIDREDGVINICEMKYSENEFSIDKKVDEELRRKIGVYQQISSTRKALHLVIITPYGLTNTIYKGIAQRVLTTDDLF